MSMMNRQTNEQTDGSATAHVLFTDLPILAICQAGTAAKHILVHHRPKVVNQVHSFPCPFLYHSPLLIHPVPQGWSICSLRILFFEGYVRMLTYSILAYVNNRIRCNYSIAV